MMVTMQEMADRLGISKSTVSLVLTSKDSGRVSPAVADRVRRCAREMGYVPNPLASSLRTNRTHILGFISEQVATTPFAGRVILGAQEAARRFDYILMTVNTNGDDGLRESEIGALKKYGVDGFIYSCMYNQSARLPDSLADQPLVLADATDAAGRVPSVVPDERRIGLDGTRRLIQAGCRTIAFIGSHGPMRAQRARLSGYRQALREAGIGYDPGLVANVHMGHEAMDKVADLFERRSPDGCFCFNDARAWYVYNEAARRGLAIGRDVSLVGVDNHQVLSEMLVPSLTTIELPHYEMGYWAACKLVSMIEQRDLSHLALPRTPAAIPSPQLTDARIHCRLVEKESVAAIP